MSPTDPTKTTAEKREEIRVLAKHANLELRPEYFEELVEAYVLVEKMLTTLRCELPYASEPAHVFVAKTFDRRAD